MAYLVVALVTVLACLNRHTGLIVPLLFLVAFPGRWRWGLLYLALGIGTLLLVREAQGYMPRVWTFERTMAANILSLDQIIIRWAALLGVWWLLVGRAVWRSQGMMRRLHLVMLAYVGTVVVFGQWREIRLLLPVLPVWLLSVRR